jgi:hypothetical protein
MTNALELETQLQNGSANRALLAEGHSYNVTR